MIEVEVVAIRLLILSSASVTLETTLQKHGTLINEFRLFLPKTTLFRRLNNLVKGN